MKNWLISHLNYLCITLVGIFTPVIPLLLSVGVMIAADFIFGIFRAIKKNENVVSRKMWNTGAKMLLYNLSVFSVYIMDQYLLKTGMHIEKIAAIFLAIVEIKSMDESFKILFGWSLWDKVLKIVRRGESNTKDFLN